MPRKTTLEQVDIYLNEELSATVREAPFEARIAVPPPAPEDFVRAVARVADGRAVEDVELLAAPGLTEEVEVNLVQLQALVTKKNGAPVADLGKDDFAIRERGQKRDIDQLSLARDVRLNLGLILDSSGSMASIWQRALAAARRFLQHTISPRDQAFLVDFDTQLRLAHPLTGELAEIFASLEEIVPEGGTALYDSVLYSLLQFADQPGRRALVLLTDGYDVNSTSDPRRSVELARKLGVPIYVIAMNLSGRGSLAGFSPVHNLKLLTDPTGGRLLRVGSLDGMARAFAQVNAELRHQYILTYYTDVLPSGGGGRDEINVRVLGRKDVEVRTVWALDQVN